MGDKDILQDSPQTSLADDNGACAKADQGATAADLDDDFIPCGPCYDDEDSKRVRSEVFCLECKEYLCTSCRQQHRKLKVTRAHHLLENGGADNEATESCPEHPGRDIEHFCEDHHALVCRACIDVSHATCKKIKQIPTEAKDVKTSKELSQGMDNLVNLIESFKRLKDVKSKQIQKTRAQKEVCRNTITDLRQRAEEFFDRLETTAVHALDGEIDSIIQTTASEEETFKSTIDTLLITKDNLERTTKTASDAQVFITLKRALRQVRTYSDFHAEVEKSLKDIDVFLKEDERFRQIFSVISMMGRVVIHEELTPAAKRSSSVTSLSSKRRKAVPAGGHTVRISGDRTTCYITGSAYLNDGRLVLADHNNKCIKMFDENFKLLSCRMVSSRPHDIAVVNQEEIVTSLMDEYMIQFVKIDTNIKTDRRLRADAQYSGLACSREPLLFACCSFREGAGNVHVLDMEGNVLHQLANTQTGDPVFVRPWSLALSFDNKFLYVNDLGNNAVMCIDVTQPSNCRTMFVYRDRNLELRNGIALDETGSIYVASGNRSVHQVSCEGSKVDEILTERNGIGLPHCLCLSPDNKLLVAEFKENIAKTFSLLTQ